MGRDASSSLEVDLDEEDGSTADPEVGNSEDFVDILDILDGRIDGDTNDEGLLNVAHTGARSAGRRETVGPGRNDDEEVEGQGNDHDGEEDDDDGGEGEDDGEEEEEEEEDLSWSADEDADPNALEGLEQFVSSLGTSKKRQGDSDMENASLPRKKRLVEEKTAVGEEREFAAPPSGSSNRGFRRIILNFTRPAASIK
jgi:U3 small nucleolar RNA-associated protein 14